MTPLGHLALSAASSAAVAWTTGDLVAAAACGIAGVFIDLDHFLEYFWYEGLKLDLADFHQACEEARFPRTLLILHSWELLAAGWLLAGMLAPGVVLQATMLGLTLHMIGDQIFNECFPGCYFLAYRLYHGCDAARCFRKAARRREAMAGVLEVS